MLQISANAAAAILRDRAAPGVSSLDDRALILALVEAFHAAGYRAAEIPADLDAIRAACATTPLRRAA